MSEAVNKRDEWREKDKETPQEERERLLKQVKADNQEIASIEKRYVSVSSNSHKICIIHLNVPSSSFSPLYLLPSLPPSLPSSHPPSLPPYRTSELQERLATVQEHNRQADNDLEELQGERSSKYRELKKREEAMNGILT